jgi:YfiH family protein
MLQSEDLRKIPTIRHAFFTRQGGVSTGLYDSLNCGLGAGDDFASVMENRRRVAMMLGVVPGRLCTLSQVHGREVHTVEKPFGLLQPAGDAMVTREPGLMLGILTADCAPVLFADPTANVIGAAHAGWKGALGGVLQATVAAMELLGAARERIVAAIGPCIARDSYEVDVAFHERFLAHNGDNLQFFKPAPKIGHMYFDLPGYAAAQLKAYGVHAISALADDTCASPGWFFSYRRATLNGEKAYGRQISGITLKSD